MSSVTSENKVFLTNASFLALMHATNSFLPLLTVPFLVRILGVELFGQLAFVTAFMYYFVVLSDYGFNLTATRDISIHREDPRKVNEIYTNVMVIKCLLLLISALVFGGLLFALPVFFEDLPLYIASFMVVVCGAFFPVWFFQGMEAMKYVTFFNVLSKILFTISVFVFVSSPEDYLLVPILTSVGLLVSVVFSFYMVHSHYKVRFQSISSNEIKNSLKEGWYVFLSQVKISLFSSTNVVILGVIAGPLAVGYYVAAEKVMRIMALAQTPITSALFPMIAKEMQKNKRLAIDKLKNIAYIGSAIYCLVIIITFFLSDFIIINLYGVEMEPSVWVFKVILVIPILIFLNNIFGTQILLNTGREKVFFFTLLLAAILSLASCFTLTYFFSYQGAAVSLLFTEVFVVFAFYFLVYRDWTDA